MTAEKSISISTDTKVWSAYFDDVSSQLLQLVSSFSEKEMNTIPCQDSWTAAQVTAHITKSGKAIVQALKLQGKTINRNPDERVQELKKTFLDFTFKMQSPKFVLPTENIYQKEALVAELKTTFGQLKEADHKINLSEVIHFPALGEMTKLELLHFVLYHTQRHLHQLKNIFEIIKNDTVGIT